MYQINTKKILLFVVIALGMVTPPASCFLSPSSSRPFITNTIAINKSSSISRINIHTFIKSTNNNKDDEIAALEEKLKLLKQEKELEQQQQQQKNESQDDEEIGTVMNEVATTTTMNGDQRSIASNLKNTVPLDEMLSESWKEDDVQEGGSIVGSLVTLVAIAVGFVILAQIPVGQEGLDKYSTAKPSTTIDLGDKNPVSKGFEIN